MEKSRKYGKRLGPRPRRSRFRRAVILPVCPARKKVHFLGMSRTKVQKIIFDGSTAASLAAPSGLQPGQNFSAGRGPAERYICSECLGQKSKTSLATAFLWTEVDLDLGKISKSTALGSELGRRHTGSSPAISPPVCPANRKGTFARNVSDKCQKILSDSTALGHGLTRRQPKLSPAKFSRLRPASFRSQWRSFRQKKSTARASGLTRRQPKLSRAISLSPSGFHFARNGVPFVRKRTWKHFEEKFQEYGTRPWTYAAPTEAEPGHLFSLSPAFISLAMAFLSSEKESGSCLWTYAAPTDAEPAQFSCLRPASFRSQRRSFRQK